MKKQQLTKGTILIQKSPSKHTDKLHKIEIKSIHTGFSYTKNRQYAYYIAQTCNNQYYPAANNMHMILDGLMGDYTLAKLKAEYRILS